MDGNLSITPALRPRDQGVDLGLLIHLRARVKRIALIGRAAFDVRRARDRHSADARRNIAGPRRRLAGSRGHRRQNILN